jgi:hypothetical protein
VRVLQNGENITERQACNSFLLGFAHLLSFRFFFALKLIVLSPYIVFSLPFAFFLSFHFLHAISGSESAVHKAEGTQGLDRCFHACDIPRGFQSEIDVEK